MIKKILSVIFLLHIFAGTILAEISSKAPGKAQRDLNLFCTNISPSNPVCQRWFEIKQKRLEVKSLIYRDIKSYCDKNPKERVCKGSSRYDILTFCTKILLQNPHCQLWQDLKQAELETKGLLSDEIKRFCQSSPENSFCK